MEKNRCREHGWNAVTEHFGSNIGEKEIRRIATRLRGRAWTWYSDLVRSASIFPFANWDAFRKKFFEEFEVYDPNTNYRDKLLELKQTKSVMEYNKQFREIICRIDGQSEADRIAMYKHGLKLKTRYEVNYYAPKTLSEAMRVARLCDETMFKGEDRSSRYRPGTKASKSANPNDDPMELDVICYKGRKKGHYQKDCTQKQTKMLNNAENNVVETEEEDKIVELNLTSSWEKNQFELIRLEGKINTRTVKCLVDSGASHNFIRKDIVDALKLKLKTDHTNEVKLANGKAMNALGVVSDVELILNGTYKSTEEFIVLESCSQEVILGRSWLYCHQPVIDWKTGKMKVNCAKFSNMACSVTSRSNAECCIISSQQSAVVLVHRLHRDSTGNCQRKQVDFHCG